MGPDSDRQGDSFHLLTTVCTHIQASRRIMQVYVERTHVYSRLIEDDLGRQGECKGDDRQARILPTYTEVFSANP